MGKDVLSGSGLDSEDTTLDVQKGDIESTATKIVDEDVPLLLGLSGTETVSNSGSGRLVDDTENVEASDGTSVLGSLTLVVIEVGRDSDDSLLDLHAELGLSNLLHLWGGLATVSTLFFSLEKRTLTRTMAEISWGENCLVSPRYSTWTMGESPAGTILKGHDWMSFLTVSSSKRRPMRRLEWSENCTRAI